MGKIVGRRARIGLLFWCAFWTVRGFAQAEGPWVWIPAKPSLVNPEAMQCEPEEYNVFFFRVGCYDVTKGKWRNCEALFMEYFSLEGVPESQKILWTGGHDHGRSTGDVYRTLGFLVSPVDESGGSDPTLFYGHTLSQGWSAYKGMPAASGVIRMMGRYVCEDTRYRFMEDDTWRYDPSDPTGRTVYTEVAFAVGIPGLEVLPDSEDYLKNSNHEGHSDPVFCGTPTMNQKLAKLAREYKKVAEGGTVSFNDLSLPYGGLYDVDQDWDCPHELHREGISADVNGTVSKQDLIALSEPLGFTECHPKSTLIHLELGPCKRKRS
jgi:hypothetical protein